MKTVANPVYDVFDIIINKKNLTDMCNALCKHHKIPNDAVYGCRKIYDSCDSKAPVKKLIGVSINFIDKDKDMILICVRDNSIVFNEIGSIADRTEKFNVIGSMYLKGLKQSTIAQCLDMRESTVSIQLNSDDYKRMLSDTLYKALLRRHLITKISGTKNVEKPVAKLRNDKRASAVINKEKMMEFMKKGINGMMNSEDDIDDDDVNTFTS